MDKKEIVQQLQANRHCFHTAFGVKIIGIFGSFARGEETKESDVDILYEIEEGKKLSLFSYLKLVKQIEEMFHKKVDLVRADAVKRRVGEYIKKDLIYV